MVLDDYESSYEDRLSKCGVRMLEIQRASTQAISLHMISETPVELQCQRPKQQHIVLNPLHMKGIASGTLCLYILKGQEALVFFKDRISK